MAKLSTHVLDNSAGLPAEGMKIELYRLDLAGADLVKTVVTNADGRTDEVLLDESAMEVGEYELRFYVADYYGKQTSQAANPPFLSVVPVRFGISDASGNYHVPLLVTPWSYSTYRGS